MPIPQPNSSETEQDYISRCMGDETMQEYEQDQRSAICYSTYRDTTVRKQIQTAMCMLDNHIEKLEKEDIREMFAPELPALSIRIRKDIKGVSSNGIKMIEDVYLKCRKDNKEVEGSYEVAKSIFQREYEKVSKGDIVYSVYNIVKDIYDNVMTERGKGMGQGNPAQQDGGTDICVCPECGEETEHGRGTPCNDVKCPECDVALVGK